jgi:hypothetical protein
MPQNRQNKNVRSIQAHLRRQAKTNRLHNNKSTNLSVPNKVNRQNSRTKSQDTSINNIVVPVEEI